MSSDPALEQTEILKHLANETVPQVNLSRLQMIDIADGSQNNRIKDTSTKDGKI